MEHQKFPTEAFRKRPFDDRFEEAYYPEYDMEYNYFPGIEDVYDFEPDIYGLKEDISWNVEQTPKILQKAAPYQNGLQMASYQLDESVENISGNFEPQIAQFLGDSQSID